MFRQTIGHALKSVAKRVPLVIPADAELGKQSVKRCGFTLSDHFGRSFQQLRRSLKA